MLSVSVIQCLLQSEVLKLSKELQNIASSLKESDAKKQNLDYCKTKSVDKSRYINIDLEQINGKKKTLNEQKKKLEARLKAVNKEKDSLNKYKIIKKFEKTVSKLPSSKELTPK